MFGIGLGLLGGMVTADGMFAPAIDQPIITSGAGTPVFATQTQHAPKRVGDNTTPVDTLGDPKFAYPGVPDGQLVAYPIAPRVRNEYIPGGDSQGRRWDMQIETVTSSRYLGLVWLPGATISHLLVFVNGKPVSTRIECAGTTGSTSHFLLTFPDNRERRIKLVFSGGQQVVRLETEEAYPPVRPASAGKTLVCIGDSLSAGSGIPPDGATYLDTWPQFTACILGFDHCCNASIGGSRWVVRTGTSPIELAHFGGGRLAPVLSLNPEAIVFAGSRNDVSVTDQDKANITAAVQAAMQASTAVAKRFVAGTFTALPQNALVKAGADAEGVPFIDMTDGFQPADIGADSVHPTYLGAVALRDRFVPRLRAAGCSIPYTQNLGIPWSSAYPLSFEKSGGDWSCDFDPDDYAPVGMFANTYWVDIATGSAGNSGLSEASPKQTIVQATTLGNASGQPYRVMVKAGYYPRQMGFSTTFVNQSCRIEAHGGRVVHAIADLVTWPGSKDATYTNTTKATRSAVCMCLDLVNLTANGAPTRLALVADAATCDATPNSYAQVGNDVYVNRGDGLVCSEANTRLLLGVTTQNCFRLTSAAAGKTVYLKGFDLQGGGATRPVVDTTGSTGAVLIMDDCTVMFSGTDVVPATALDAIAINHPGAAFFRNCIAAEAGKDGFNYHNNAGGSAYMLTMDCESFDCGRATGSTSNNGLTIHENVVGIDVNGHYHHTKGGSVRNVHDSQMLALGTVAGPDTTDGVITPAGFQVDTNSIMYLIDCSAEMASPSDYAARKTESAHLYLRNFNADGATISGTELMPADIMP